MAAPLALVAALPDELAALPATERERRAVVGDENCALDDQRFFVRGNLVVPIDGHDGHDGHDAMIWTIWVELPDRRSYKRTLALWGHGRRDREPAIACTLATELPVAPGSRGLRAALHLGAPGRRPVIRLEPAAHALVELCERGVALATATAWVRAAGG
jgi:hypothetical protein